MEKEKKEEDKKRAEITTRQSNTWNEVARYHQSWPRGDAEPIRTAAWVSSSRASASLPPEAGGYDRATVEKPESPLHTPSPRSHVDRDGPACALGRKGVWGQTCPRERPNLWERASHHQWSCLLLRERNQHRHDRLWAWLPAPPSPGPEEVYPRANPPLPCEGQTDRWSPQVQTAGLYQPHARGRGRSRRQRERPCDGTLLAGDGTCTDRGRRDRASKSPCPYGAGTHRGSI